MKPNKPAILSWCLYDWANSAYFAVVLTFIFAAYFTRGIAPNIISGTRLWGNAIAISGLLIAILSPICGAIADHGGYRKVWLFCTTYLGIIATALLWYAYPNARTLNFTLVCVVISNFAFEVGIVFYNALLVKTAPPNYLGRISGWGWGLGYLGGLSCLSIALFVFVQSPPSWLSTTTSAQVRICGPLVAVWVVLFSLPLFLFVKDPTLIKMSTRLAVKQGLRTLGKTLRELLYAPNIFIFLIARMIYTDGLNTLFAFGGIYAAGTFGMSITQVIYFGIALNITAGIGAASFAFLDDYLGSKKTILIALSCLIAIGAVVLTIRSQHLFWIFAPLLGLFVGPSQAASRSLMARLTPAAKINEMFGLYALSGKATAFIGPWLVAETTYLFSSQRVGMSVIFIFFISGAALLCLVRKK